MKFIHASLWLIAALICAVVAVVVSPLFILSSIILGLVQFFRKDLLPALRIDNKEDMELITRRRRIEDGETILSEVDFAEDLDEHERRISE